MDKLVRYYSEIYMSIRYQKNLFEVDILNVYQLCIRFLSIEFDVNKAFKKMELDYYDLFMYIS